MLDEFNQPGSRSKTSQSNRFQLSRENIVQMQKRNSSAVHNTHQFRQHTPRILTIEAKSCCFDRRAVSMWESKSNLPKKTIEAGSTKIIASQTIPRKFCPKLSMKSLKNSPHLIGQIIKGKLKADEPRSKILDYIETILQPTRFH